MSGKRFPLRAALLGGGCALAFPTFVLAQSEPASQEAATTIDEVVVTARRRDETPISVPVAVTALSAQQLSNLAIDSFADLSTAVPNLTVAQISSGIGGSIYLRGIGTNAGQNASFEQTVSVNIDGVQVSRGQALRVGQFDMQRVEVLRGPQALFFGKNSPAGVISIATAAPTDTLEAMVRASYEVNARERGIEGFVSGPIAETLKGRLAFNYTEMDGWEKNLAYDVQDAANAIVPGIANTLIRRGPQAESYTLRGSTQWTPIEALTVDLRLTHTKSEGPGFQQGPNERIACAYGTPQLNTVVNAATTNPAQRAALLAAITLPDCSADGRYAYTSIPAAQLVNSPLGKDEKGLNETAMTVGSLQANWTITPSLSLTSVTGYVTTDDKRYDTYSYAPIATVIGVNFGGTTATKQVSQEFRLLSDFQGPFNFLTGAYYEKSELSTFIQQFTTPGPRFDQMIDGETVSAFLQGTYDLTDQLELSGGVRWTREDRDLVIDRDGVRQPVSPANATFENTSPELTLTWRPSDTLTVFAGYRSGFKSGGFATPLTGGAAFTAPGPNYKFEPEEVDGYELGVKASLLDRQLRANWSVFSYDYTNLQVSTNDTSGPLPVLRTTNAAAASIFGVESDYTFRPRSLPGLTLRGALNYSDNSFDRFDATCYIGQTQAEGCNLNLSTGTGRYTAQSLAGRRLPSSMKWSGSLGGSYEGALGSGGVGYLVGLDTTYRSANNPQAELDPNGLQRAVWFVNASARLYSDDRGWEAALVARNLTEEYRATQVGNVPLTGNGTLTGSPTTGGHADLAGYVNRGREILFQVTLRY